MHSRSLFKTLKNGKAITNLTRPELMIDNIDLALLKDTRRLLRSHFDFKVQHNFQEGNRFTDRLANLEIDKRLDTGFFSLPLTELLHV